MHLFLFVFVFCSCCCFRASDFIHVLQQQHCGFKVMEERCLMRLPGVWRRCRRGRWGLPRGSSCTTSLLGTTWHSGWWTTPGPGFWWWRSGCCDNWENHLKPQTERRNKGPLKSSTKWRKLKSQECPRFPSQEPVDVLHFPSTPVDPPLPLTCSAAVSAHSESVVPLGHLERRVFGEHRLVFVSQVDAQTHLGHGCQVVEALQAWSSRRWISFRQSCLDSLQIYV